MVDEPSRELEQLEKAQQIFEKMLGFHMDSLQRSNIHRKIGDNCLEILKYKSDQQICEKAIASYETALKTYTADSHPIFRAKTMLGLGFAYSACAKWKDRSRCLKLAISCWEQALLFYPPSDSPLDYACIQEGLGQAYRKLAEMEKRKENSEKAAFACQEALRFSSCKERPVQFAGLMADLASSYLTLAQADNRRENCKKAIAAYIEALQVYTADIHPLQYAAMQNNLAIAYLSQAEGDDALDTGTDSDDEMEGREECCRLAIAACEQALLYRTLAEHPLAYAATENNLGNAYLALIEEREDRDSAGRGKGDGKGDGTGDGDPDRCPDRLRDGKGAESDNWEKAYAAFSSALQIYSKEEHPRQYATTQNNLANVYLAWRGEGSQSLNNCLKAIRAAEEALSIFSFDESPEDYAEAQGTLWLARLTMADFEMRAENCALALDACQERLKALRACGRPRQIASCCKDLAITASTMADLELSVQAKAQDCKTAISAAKEALNFYDSDGSSAENAETQILLWAAYSALSEVEQSSNNCRKAIDSCRAAIAIYARVSPSEHADAQKSLGYSLITLAEMEGGEDAASNCEKAIEAYRLALEHYTIDAYPVDHADILRDLAYAYVVLSGALAGESKEESCRKALKAYKTASKIYISKAQEREKAGERAEASLLQEQAEKCHLSMQSCKAIIKAGRKSKDALESAQDIQHSKPHTRASLQSIGQPDWQDGGAS